VILITGTAIYNNLVPIPCLDPPKVDFGLSPTNDYPDSENPTDDEPLLYNTNSDRPVKS